MPMTTILSNIHYGNWMLLVFSSTTLSKQDLGDEVKLKARQHNY